MNNSKKELVQREMDAGDLSPAFIPALTGMRAIAAYMVYIHHFNFIPRGILHDIAKEFHIGVTIFFVLSGFLIGYRYSEIKSTTSLKDYFINRFARIYPMYFLFTTITFLIPILFWNASPRFFVYFTNITFARGFFDELKFTGVAQGWTLTVEVMFYILVPLMILLLQKNSWYFIFIPFVTFLAGLGMVEFFGSKDYYGFFGSSQFMISFTFFGRIFELFIGLAFAFLLKNKFFLKKNIWLTNNVTALAVFFILLALVVIYSLNPGNDYGIISHPFGRVVNSVFLPIAIVALFYGLIYEKTYLQKCLSSRLMIILGKSSYVFYLIHMGFVNHFLAFINPSYAFIFVGLNVISIVMYYWIEKPISNLIRDMKLG